MLFRILLKTISLISVLKNGLCASYAVTMVVFSQKMAENLQNLFAKICKIDMCISCIDLQNVFNSEIILK